MAVHGHQRNKYGKDISNIAAELWRFSVFQNGGRRHLGFGWILLSDHPRSIPDDLNLYLKFYVDPIYISKILRFQFSKIWLKKK